MTEELYIEGKQVDLLPNKVTRNLQIGKLGDVADRESSYSNTVKLPMTARNIEIFEFLGISGNTSRHQYKKLRCRYIVDGIPLISSGYCVVQSLTEAYEVVLYDGIIDVGEKLKDKLISELNYNDINHYLSPNNLENNIDNQQYVYAIGDYGVPRNEDGSFQSEYIAPSIYVSDLWDRILTQNGFQYVGRFFQENEFFQTEVLAPGVGYSVRDEEFESYELGGSETDKISRDEVTSQPEIYEDKLSLITADIDETTYDATTKELTFEFDGEISFSYETIQRIMRDNRTIRVHLQFRLNGETVVEHRLSQTAQSTKTFTLRVTPGDKLTMWVKGTDIFAYQYDSSAYDPDYLPPRHSAGDGVTGGYEYIIRDYDQYLNDRYIAHQYRVKYTVGISFEITKISGGQLIKFEEIVPELGQLEFVKDVVQRYGLLIRPTQNPGVYEFVQFEEILNNRVGAEDWSDNYVATREEKYDTTYGRINEATFKYPSEIEVPTHDGKISVDVETLKDKSTMFSSPYTISFTDKKFLGQSIYQIPIWKYDPDGEDEEGNPMVVIENTETSPRIFRIGFVEGTVKLKYFGANSTEVTGQLPILTLKNMQMQFFLNNYYKSFSGVIKTYKEVHMDMFFNEIEVYNINFFRLKYLKQYGKYFYLNKLRYSAGEVGVGVLIELNEFSSNEVPTQLGNITVNMTKYARKSITLDMFYSGYYDPEFDDIKAIKITSGFAHTGIRLSSNRVIVSSETVIPVVNGQISLDVIERSRNLIADTNTFTYQVMDAGSGKWSEVQGNIIVNVTDYVNEGPTIDFFLHGTGFILGNHQLLDADGNETGFFVMGIWALSSDNTGHIVSELWEMIEQPELSQAYIRNPNDGTTSIMVPINDDSIGTYRCRYTVTDSHGATTVRETGPITVEAKTTRTRPDGEPDSPYRG